jgi:hypothetical protein
MFIAASCYLVVIGSSDGQLKAVLEETRRGYISTYHQSTPISRALAGGGSVGLEPINIYLIWQVEERATMTGVEQHLLHIHENCENNKSKS